MSALLLVSYFPYVHCSIATKSLWILMHSAGEPGLPLNFMKDVTNETDVAENAFGASQPKPRPGRAAKIGGKTAGGRDSGCGTSDAHPDPDRGGRSHSGREAQPLQWLTQPLTNSSFFLATGSRQLSTAETNSCGRAAFNVSWLPLVTHYL